MPKRRPAESAPATPPAAARRRGSRASATKRSRGWSSLAPCRPDRQPVLASAHCAQLGADPPAADPCRLPPTPLALPVPAPATLAAPPRHPPPGRTPPTPPSLAPIARPTRPRGGPGRRDLGGGPPLRAAPSHPPRARAGRGRQATTPQPEDGPPDGPAAPPLVAAPVPGREGLRPPQRGRCREHGDRERVAERACNTLARRHRRRGAPAAFILPGSGDPALHRLAQRPKQWRWRPPHGRWRRRLPPSGAETKPPASRTSSSPAAISQRLRPSSQKPSNRPAATQARSSAAEPNRRIPATCGMSSERVAENSALRGTLAKGMPVANSASSRWRRPETRMRRSLRKAPDPFSAQKSSSVAGLNTTPAMISAPPSGRRFSTPMLMAQCGMPCRKLVVPSSGSTTQRYSQASAPPSPPSSPRKPKAGRARERSPRSTSSARRSASENEIPGPFTLAWRFCTSPKSLSSPRPAGVPPPPSPAAAPTLVLAQEHRRAPPRAAARGPPPRCAAAGAQGAPLRLHPAVPADRAAKHRAWPAGCRACPPRPCRAACRLRTSRVRNRCRPPSSPPPSHRR